MSPRVTQTYGSMMWQTAQTNAARPVKTTRDAVQTDDAAIKVSMSPEAQALADKASASPDDDARIARLREAVQNGTLNIDPRAIAERIVGKD